MKRLLIKFFIKLLENRIEENVIKLDYLTGTSHMSTNRISRAIHLQERISALRTIIQQLKLEFKI